MRDTDSWGTLHRPAFETLEPRLLLSGTIEGQVWEDLNGDGIRSSNEPGVDGITVELVNRDSSLVVGAQSTASDDRDGSGSIDPVTEAGWYSFTALPTAPYEVRIVLPGGSQQFRPSFGDDPFLAQAGSFPSAIAINDSGAAVVVYRNDTTEMCVRAFLPDGTPTGPATEIGRVGGTRVAIDAQGNFVVIWHDETRIGDDTSRIMARTFLADGTPRGGAFQVNTYDVGNQSDASVGIRDDGQFIVAWRSMDFVDPAQILARRYLADGTPLGSEFIVNTTDSNAIAYPSVASNSAGESVIVWESLDQGIYGQMLHADGSAYGGEFRIDTAVNNMHRHTPAVGVEDAGGFVVTWRESGNSTPVGIFARKYASDGTPTGDPFQVNTTEEHSNDRPSIAMGKAGRFVITWRHRYDAHPDPWVQLVLAQRYDETATAVGTEFLLEDESGRPDMDWEVEVAALGNADRFLGMANGPDYQNVYLHWFSWDSANNAYWFDIEAGDTITPANFAVFFDASVAGQSFEDVNDNGQHDPGEPGRDGWTIELVDADTQEVIATTVTASVDLNEDGVIDPATEVGLYTFEGILAGAYTVREVVPTGWQGSAPQAISGELEHVETLQDGVDGNDYLNGSYKPVISADGQFVYVPGRYDAAISVFQRDAATGELTLASVVRNDYGGVTGLIIPETLAISPDGGHVYALSNPYGASGGSMVVFSRDAVTGELVFVQAILSEVDVPWMNDPQGITVSADGTQVYVTSVDDDALHVFTRDPATGLLALAQTLRSGYDGTTLNYPRDIVASADGQHVYVTSGSAVAIFQRDEATGLLSYMQHTGTGGPTSISLADGDRYLYVATRSDQVMVYERDPNTGELTQLYTASAYYDPVDLAVSADGQLAAVALPPGGGTITVFRRGQDGYLLERGGMAEDSIGNVFGLGGLTGVAISPDLAHLYATGGTDDTVVVFTIGDYVVDYYLTLISGDEETGIDFGNIDLVNVSGQVLDDADNNGLHDAGEPGRDWWIVELVDTVTGEAVATATTASIDTNQDGTIDPETETGLYGFYGITPGSYEVRLVVESGHSQTYPAGVYPLVLTSGDPDVTDIDFGAFLSDSAEIHGQKFEDLNANGIHDAGEPGLDGWTIELVDMNTGQIVATTTTASIDVNGNGAIDPETESGLYSFAGLAPGPYEVREIQQVGWRQTTQQLSSGELEFLQIFRQDQGYSNLYGPWDVKVSPDGRHVYVGADALFVFARDPFLGTLTLVQEIENDGAYTTDNVWSLAISPDGRDMYFSGGSPVPLWWFRRNTVSGKLTFVARYMNDDPFFEDMGGVVYTFITPDGRNVYLRSGAGKVLVLARDKASGELSPVQKLDGVNPGPFIYSPDEQYFHIGSKVYQRDLATGALTFLTTRPDYFTVYSPDGTHVYGPWNDSINAYTWDPATGDMTLLATYTDGEGGIDGLSDVQELAISPDGLYLLASSSDGPYDDRSLVLFRRDPLSGELTYLDVLFDNEDGVDGLHEVRKIAFSQGGRYIYAVSLSADNSVAVFSYDDGPLPLQFNLIPDQVVSNADFGNARLGSISGQVFHDLDVSGVREPGEQGLDGLTVELIDTADGSVALTAMTKSADLNGNGVIDPETEAGLYAFDTLLSGAFEIRLVAPVDWAQSYPVGSGHPIALGYGDTLAGYDFGAIESATLIGQIFDDHNADGIKDVVEGRLNGWTVEIVDAATSNVVATAVTMDVDLDDSGSIDPATESGIYVVDTLLPGEYEIRQVAQTGWSQTFPVSGTHLLTVAAGQTYEDLDFGNEPADAEVAGQVFGDLDGDGVRDGDEVGVNGWTVELVDPATGGVMATATTASIDLDENGLIDPATERGRYRFAGLVQDDYEVRQVVPAGWQQTAPMFLDERAFAAEVVGGAMTIHEIDPTDGSTLNSFAAPANPVSVGYQGLAIGPDSLFYVDANDWLTPTLWELDLDTGAVIDSDPLTFGAIYVIKGLAYLDGLLYIQYMPDQVAVWDPASDSFIRMLTISAAVMGGLTGAGDLGVLFDSNAAGEIIAIDPTDGSVLSTFATGLGALDGGLAYVGGELLAIGSGIGSLVHRIDPSTGAVVGSFALGVTGSVVGLGGDMPSLPVPVNYAMSLGPSEVLDGQDFGNLAPAVAGDFNGDGLVDSLDIDLLYANQGDAAYDLDGDNDADSDDIDVLVHDILNTEYGDINLDGLVDATDLAIMKVNFGRSGVGWAQANANGDGVVDGIDLAILKTYFGFESPGEALPVSAAPLLGESDTQAEPILASASVIHQLSPPAATNEYAIDSHLPLSSGQQAGVESIEAGRPALLSLTANAPLYLQPVSRGRQTSSRPASLAAATLSTVTPAPSLPTPKRQASGVPSPLPISLSSAASARLPVRVDLTAATGLLQSGAPSVADILGEVEPIF